jgi:hypothetical protein
LYKTIRRKLLKKLIVLFCTLFIIVLVSQGVMIHNIQSDLSSITSPRVIVVEKVKLMTEKEIIKMISDSVETYEKNNIQIDKYIICGLAKVESNFRPDAKVFDSNKKYSYGLFQVQLEKALLYDKNATPEKLLTPEYNIYIMLTMYKDNLSKFKSVKHAIAAHNAGSANIKANREPFNIAFVNKVRQEATKLWYNQTGI